MARKETIYVVSAEDNIIIRASRSTVSALEFAAGIKQDFYVCTSAFGNLKKGDPMVERQDTIWSSEEIIRAAA